MRIAILTFNNTHNFGAELQSYALQQFLISMGYEAFHICTSSFYRGNSIKSKIKAILSKESDRRYDEFIRNRLEFYPGQYNEESICELNDKFEVFLSGSDQVWNVANGVSSIFFQQFVPDNKLKISYAASVGISAIPEIYADEVSRSLSKFDAVSVREGDAVKLLSNYTDKYISQNIDPVFLIPAEKWDEIAGERIEKKPYIFVYGTQMTDEIKQVAYKIQKETGYQIISVFRMPKAKSVDEKIGPEEFVNYVKYADYVVTTSFHCTAFSIIYHKNLVEVLHSTTGSRARNLLESFNQTDSIYSGDFNLNKIWDYSEADTLIERYREQAFLYLSGALRAKSDGIVKNNTLSELRLQRIGTPPNKAVIGISDVYCTGCEMCVSLCPKQAITMKPNDNGFFYPEIDSSKCIDCGICHKSCPAVYNHSNERRNNASSLKEIYALRSSEMSIRKNSSSGGAFVHLSDLILDAGGVVYGCKFNDSFEAVCGRAESKEQRDEFRGAKYIQSRMHDSYKQIEADLRNGRKVMFSGVPCQVDAVKTFLAIRKVDTTNLYTVELICHGCPSPVLWKEHLADLSKKYKSNVKSVTFRAKDSIGNAQALLICFDNGKTYFARSGHDDYYRLFLQNTTLRPSCFSCRYAKEERVADITLGDWWGGNRMRHEFTVDHMGCSQVHVNTDKGKQLFDALDKDKIEYFEISEKQAFQPNLRHPTRKSRVYDCFLASYEKKGFTKAALNVASKKEKIQIVLQGLRLNEVMYKFRHR